MVLFFNVAHQTGMFVTDGSGTFAVPMQPYQPLAAPTQFIPGVPGVDQLQAGVMSMSVGQAVQCSVPGRQKCAIPECPNPSYIDENGTVHKCCGRTHAKELEQRQCRVPQIFFCYCTSILLFQHNKIHLSRQFLLLPQLLGRHLGLSLCLYYHQDRGNVPFKSARIHALLTRLELSTNAVESHTPWNTRGERPLNNVGLCV